jgi:hypothetical protein
VRANLVLDLTEDLLPNGSGWHDDKYMNLNDLTELNYWLFHNLFTGVEISPFGRHRGERTL